MITAHREGGAPGRVQRSCLRRQDDDYYSQPRLLFRLMAAEKKALFENTARAMGDAPKQVKVRHIGNCMKADPDHGEVVAKAVGIPLSQLSKNR